jgi:hypothetical protein
MKKLKVLAFNEIENQSIQGLSFMMDKMERHTLELTPWAAYSYKPTVHFSIAYNGNTIFLKYYVTEKFIQAAAGKINGSVWEDSCVEFFVGFGDEGYYNLEFNCIGTIFAAFGNERNGREHLSEEVIRTIKYHTVIYNNNENDICWQLTLAIPLNVFSHHAPASLTEKQCRANFYKCGDRLPQPHFLSWSNIEAPEPNFHLPNFFGVLVFQ